MTDGQGGGRAVRARRAKHKYAKCFRLVLKNKGNASLFSNFVWRAVGRGAGGRRGQPCQTEIYFMFVHFYCFKCFRIILKSKGNASLFFNFGLGKEMLTILEFLFGGRQTEICFRIVCFYCLKCFR